MGIPIRKSLDRPGVPMVAGINQAVITAIKDLGEQPDNFNPGKTKRQVIAVFKNAAGQEASRFYSPSFHKKAKLTGDLETIFGGTVPERIKEMEDLIGTQCQVLVIQEKNLKGYTNAKIKTVLPPVANQNVVPAAVVAPAAEGTVDDEIGF